jgi:hypothetical protein
MEEVGQCYSEEGMGVSMLQKNQTILGIQNPIKSYARAAGRKSPPRFPRQMTKNCCAWGASAKQEYQRRKYE